MKYLLTLGVLILIMALTIQPTIEETAEKEIQHSQELADSASVVLQEMHKLNDSLLIQKYFYGVK
jgi:hypothetical protein